MYTNFSQIREEEGKEGVILMGIFFLDKSLLFFSYQMPIFNWMTNLVKIEFLLLKNKQVYMVFFNLTLEFQLISIMIILND